MVANEVAESLTVIFNWSLQTGIISSAWKFSNVTPVYKKGDRSDLENFHPISVVPVAAKPLKKFIANQLRSYMKSCHHNYARPSGSISLLQVIQPDSVACCRQNCQCFT